jgi:hypothetical protein
MWQAKMHDDDRVIAEAEGILECVAAADATGIWDMAPGSAAPYYYFKK